MRRPTSRYYMEVTKEERALIQERRREYARGFIKWETPSMLTIHQALNVDLERARYFLEYARWPEDPNHD